MKQTAMKASFALLLTAGSSHVALAQPAADPFVRYPDICNGALAFSFAGDIWVKDAGVQVARQLTSSAGTEYFPKFSPDCKQIAFTGEIDGDAQVYVVAAAGGAPLKLTSHPARRNLSPRWGVDNQVTGWMPNGASILFRSARDAAMVSQGNLYTVEVKSKNVAPAGPARAGAGVFSPDGNRIAYSPWSADFRRWRHYRGGFAQDLWLFDKATNKAERLTQTDATERDPVWTDKGLFFLSDRNGAMNLFRQSAPGEPAVQLTQHKDDASSASGGKDGKIVYEVKGRIWTFDPSTGVSTQQSIALPSEAMQARAHFQALDGSIEGFSPGPAGNTALIQARGNLYLIGNEDKPAIAITSGSAWQDRDPMLSPDGKMVVFISDRSGEEQLWLAGVEGGAARQLTKANVGRLAAPLWSPDGKHILVSGHDGAIKLVNSATGDMRVLGRSGSMFVHQHVWSPDSRLIAYAHYDGRDMGQIRIYDLQTGQDHLASDPFFNAFSPAFAADGRSLYYITDREFSPQMTSTEWNFHLPPKRAIVMAPLYANAANPFLAIGQVTHENPKAQLDLAGTAERLFRVPASSANIVAVAATGDDVIFAKSDGNQSGETFQILKWNFAKREERLVEDGLSAFQFSADSKSLVMRRGADLTARLWSSDTATKLSTGRLATQVDPRQEWSLIVDQVCRRYRDYFYVPNMHGFDWKAICASYKSEVPRIYSRGDLTELISRMIAELNVGHAYIDGKDEARTTAPLSGALGAFFSFDAQKRGWKIDRILKGDPVDPGYRSPIGEPGIGIEEGNILKSIDGNTLTEEVDPFTALKSKFDQPVSLGIEDQNTGRRFAVQVKTRANQEQLVYRQWVDRNREQVEKLSGGRLGYVHIPAMSTAGLAEFSRSYFSQIRKDGLLVDIRGNMGGNVSPLILERLSRPFMTTGHIAGYDAVSTYPWGNFTQVFTGKLGLLVNEATMSDGDTMAYEWRKLGLGPIYGKRTWGGTVGTGGIGPLKDGTETAVPQYGLADTSGNWIVEGLGVPPDTEIDFDAEAKLGEDDPQLAEAARLLLGTIKGTPGTLPKAGMAPDKTHSPVMEKK